MRFAGFSNLACWLAALAYASGFKRVGHWHLVGAIAAELACGAEVVFSGQLPRARRLELT